MTDHELAQHYRQGVGDTCLVCDQRLFCQLTDYHGEGRCQNCGTTYDLMGCKITDESLTRLGLKKEEVAHRTCSLVEIVPLLRAYWREVGKMVPFGCYLMNTPITKEERDSFYQWLNTNADEWRPQYPDEFNWDGIAAHFREHLEYVI